MNQSQFREHLVFTWKNKLRYFLQKRRIGAMGKGVHIDKNVEFMRFPENITINNDVVVKEGVRICSCNKEAKINIGDRSTIGYHTFIFASSEITIGKDCLIAPFVYFVDSNHQIKKNININQQPNEVAPIHVGNDVWIASNVTILKGVTIGNGAIIAANSVVNRDIPPNAIYGGSPAQLIGKRE